MYVLNKNTSVVSRFDLAQMRQLISLMKFYESDEDMSESESEVDLMIQLSGMVGEDGVMDD